MPLADVVIVGGGLAGLVAGWLAARRGLHVVVLEAERRLGGRARQIDYPSRGNLVAGGAGIGRKRRDVRLRRLLHALRVPFKTFRHRVYYGGRSRQRIRTFLANSSNQLRLAALNIKRAERKAVAAAARPTFAALLRATLGTAGARRFRELMGFGDDERADGVDTALQYNFRDNFGLGIGLRVPWNLLAERLSADIRRRGGEVRVRARVQRLLVGVGGVGGAVVAGRGTTTARTWLAGDRLVLALPSSSASRLLRGHMAPSFPAASVLPRAQPFLLAYDTAASADSRAILARAVPRYRVLPGSPLQKMIPINSSRGVYMVAYADGERARRLARRIGVSRLSSSPLSPPSRCRVLRDEVRRALKLPALRFVGESQTSVIRSRPACLVRYLPEGTHYHPPLPRARFSTRAQALAALSSSLPDGWSWVGEAVATRDQGWVEGALESVERELGNDWGYIPVGSKQTNLN